MMRGMVFSGIKKLRPLYLLDYHKEDAKRLLRDREYAGQHARPESFVVPGSFVTRTVTLAGRRLRFV